jgi:hypothetical protein
MRRGRALVLAAMAIVGAWFSVATVITQVQYFEPAVDLHIPILAAQRWLLGEPPYLGNAFSLPAGSTLPFLYPPYVLPFAAVLGRLPASIVDPAWLALCVLAAVWACRRLAIPWAATALLLLWPPFFEGLITGNVQMFLFAAFVAAFWTPVFGSSREPRPRNLQFMDSRTGRITSLLSAFVGAIKVSQVHPFLFVFRFRPIDALFAGLAVAVVAAGTLPLVGVGAWFGWIEQLQRASNPNWIAIGVPLSVMVGPLAAFVVAVMTIAAVRFVPPATAGPWLGLLVVLAAPSLHTHTFLFLLPAMLVVRREIGVAAYVMVASVNPFAEWGAVAMLTWTMAAGRVWPVLFELGRSTDLRKAEPAI